MRMMTLLLVMVGMVAMAACGWSGNQKKGVRLATERGFVKGLEKSGAEVDKAVLDKWLDCVVTKITTRFKSFDEFKNNQSHPDVKKFNKACADETKLFDAIKKKGAKKAPAKKAAPAKK